MAWVFDPPTYPTCATFGLVLPATKLSHVELKTLSAFGKIERTFLKTAFTARAVYGGPVLSAETRLARAVPLEEIWEINIRIHVKTK